MIAEILGKNAQMLVAKKWKAFGKGVLMFALITLPASAINRFVDLEHYLNDSPLITLSALP